MSLLMTKYLPVMNVIQLSCARKDVGNDESVAHSGFPVEFVDAKMLPKRTSMFSRLYASSL